MTLPQLEFEQRYFVTPDGTKIGYQVFGNPKGQPVLLANGLGGSYLAYCFLIDHFKDKFRFYCWDYRGVYSSGEPMGGDDSLHIQNHADDAVALLDHEKLDKVFAFGWSMGVQVLVEMCRHHGDRFDNLVLHKRVAGKAFHTLKGATVTAPAAKKLLKVSQRLTRVSRFVVDKLAGSELFVRTIIKAGIAHRDLDKDVFNAIAARFKELDMGRYAKQLLLLDEHDARDVLPTIYCPVLLVQGTHDPMTPLSEAQIMVDAIPNGQLVSLQGGSHYAAVEFPELMNDHVGQFWLPRLHWSVQAASA
ncbi:MAG: hypothetical protein CMH56_01755 [Myxococcales bacterium]|nr:hypothetical protein [Myxococcales bacterium]